MAKKRPESGPGYLNRAREKSKAAASDCSDGQASSKIVAATKDPKITSAEPKERQKGRALIRVDELLMKLDADATGLQTLSQGQRKSIEILLNKALPNLQATTISGDPEGTPVQTKHTVEFVNAPPRQREV